MIRLVPFIRAHALSIYFVLTFAISWAGVLLVIGGPSAIPSTAAENERLFPWVYLAMLAGPSLAGLLLTVLTGGRDGLRELVTRLCRWRVGTRWYAVALLTAPLVSLGVLLGLSRLSPDFRPGILSMEGRASLLWFGILVGLGAGIFEELGWTGFAIPRLRRGHGVIARGLFLGMIWGAWHILVNLWGATGSAIRSPGAPGGEISWVFMLPVLLSTIGLGALPAYRVLMVWVYDRTGSLLVGMLMHVSLTTSLLILRPTATGVDLVTYELALAAALWLVLAAFVAASGRLTEKPLPSPGTFSTGEGATRAA